MEKQLIPWQIQGREKDTVLWRSLGRKKVNDGSTSHQGLLGAHPEVLELYLSRKGQLWVQVTSLGVVALARTHCILAAFPTLHQAEGRLGMELTPSGGLSGHTLTVAFPTVPKN